MASKAKKRHLRTASSERKAKRQYASRNEPKKSPISLRETAQVRNSFSATVGGAVAAACAYSFFAGALPSYAQNEERPGETRELPPVVVEGEEIGSGNPYADPDAPYKVDASANTKLTEPLLTTPKSITVIPKEVLADTEAQSFRDVMRTQPGITLGTGEGGNAFGDRIFIRGFDARNDVYIDGMRDPGVIQREVFAVEQIEILKGPSSGFAGRGTTGGAVNIVSKAPSDSNFNEAEVTVGTDDTKRLTVDSNYVVDERLSLRGNVMGHEAGVAGRDVVENERWGAAAAAAFKATDDVELSLDYYHLNTDDIPDWGVPFDERSQRPFEDQNRELFYGLKNRDFWETQTDTGTAKVNALLSDSVSLNSKLRYGRTTNEYVVSAPERPDISDPDPANWTLSSSPKNRNSETEYYINQTDVTVDFETGSVGHTLVTGFELSYEEIENDPFVGLDSESGEFTSLNAVIQPIFNPDPYQPFVTPIVPSGNVRTTEVETAALYVLDTVKLTDQLELLAGVRLDHYDVSLKQSGPDRDGNPVPNLSSEDTLINWHTGAVYKVRPNGSFYVAYGSSSNPTGEQLDGSGIAYGGLAPETENLDPEKNRLYEVGTKWELFDRNLLLTAALFQIDKEDARVVSGPRGSQTVSLDGEQRVQGFELGFAGKLMPEWTLYGGLTLLDTEVKESDNPEEIGKSFPNIADTSFLLLSKYRLTEKFELGGQAYYQSKIYGGSTVAGDANLPQYWRFDLLSDYEVTENVEVSLNVLNLTDERYYDSIYRSATPFVYVAPGRAVYMTLGLRF
ncbi:MAG: TonB-dependent siderophore receptor [Bdellovibrionales bacterium]|nr:TonB-dependent siderophore receptor [Bdellovibrionales bacterium]